MYNVRYPRMSDGAADAVELSVVIPMHNSAAVVEHTIAAWLGRLTSGLTELILVENGSRDGTWQLAQRFALDNANVRFTLLQSETGMGNALRVGIAASTGQRVLLSADDLPFGFDDLDEAAKLETVPPVVIGSKAHPDSVVERGIARDIFTLGYRWLRFMILGSRVGDTQGTILADGDWLRSVGPSLDEGGFLFTTQLVVIAEAQSLQILEVPVTLVSSDTPKESTVRLVDVIEMGNGLLRLRRSGRAYRHAGATAAQATAGAGL